MIVQPRFDRVLVPLPLRPRGAGAGPLHDQRGVSLWSAGAGFPLQLGSLPRRSRTRLETLPPSPCFSRAGFRRSCSVAGPASCRAPPLQVLTVSRCGGRGVGVPQPRAFPGVCLRLALEVSLVSRFRGKVRPEAQGASRVVSGKSSLHFILIYGCAGSLLLWAGSCSEGGLLFDTEHGL